MSGTHTLVHAITGEHSRFRRWALYIFARYLEMPLLRWCYHLLRGRHRRLGRNRLVRALLGWSIAAPLGYLGDTARPVPYPQVLQRVDGLDGPMAVGPCRCRLAHGGCTHPLATDIVIRTGVEAWTRAFPSDYRLVSKEEVKRIITQCHRQGLWHMVFIHCPVNQENEYVICNCCTCGCVPYILNRELGQRMYPLLRGEYVARVDEDRCAGHGACVDACPFDAWALVDGKVRQMGECFGCGKCVTACPSGAIEMVAGTGYQVSGHGRNLKP
jgi:NAD-dependent dihydropyrimidine dehydrogenase PreA subunit